jgi:hypothetical protein
VHAWYADDGRIFVDPAYIVELAKVDVQEAEAILAILKDYLKQRPA